MLTSFVFALTVLAVTMKCGYELGDLSLTAIVLIVAVWLVTLGATIVLGWTPAVMVVASLVLAIGMLLVVFGDLRIR